MSKTYEKFIGPDGVLRIGHSLARRHPEPKLPEQPDQMLEATKAQQQPVEAKAAQKFTTRLRSILELPEAGSKARQALAVAVETRASVKEAAAILAALPDDEVAGFPHGGTLFPVSTVEHDAEQARIIAILRSAEAEGREAQALGLATETTLSAGQIATLLASMPKVEAQRIPPIFARALEEKEFGGDEFENRETSSRRADPWKKVIDKANGITNR